MKAAPLAGRRAALRPAGRRQRRHDHAAVRRSSTRSRPATRSSTAPAAAHRSAGSQDGDDVLRHRLGHARPVQARGDEGRRARRHVHHARQVTGDRPLAQPRPAGRDARGRRVGRRPAHDREPGHDRLPRRRRDRDEQRRHRRRRRHGGRRHRRRRPSAAPSTSSPRTRRATIGANAHINDLARRRPTRGSRCSSPPPTSSIS